MTIGVLLLVLAGGFTGFVFLATYRDSSEIITFLVGASAGLVDELRVGRIHLFTILVVLWVLTRNRDQLRGGRLLKLALCVVAATPLALTVVTGDLVDATLALQLLALAGSAGLIAAFCDGEDRHRMLWGLLTTVTLSSPDCRSSVSCRRSSSTPTSSSVGRPPGSTRSRTGWDFMAAIGVVIAWRLVPRGPWRNLLLAANGAARPPGLRACSMGGSRGCPGGRGPDHAGHAPAGVLASRRYRPGRRIPSRHRSSDVRLFPVAAGRPGQAGRDADDDDPSHRRERHGESEQNQGLLQLAATAPWYGHGLSTSGRVGVSGNLNLGGESQNNVGSNWVLSMWVDGRLLAIPLIALLLVVAFRRARTLPGQLLLLTLVNSLFSNATFTPILWALLGLTLGIATRRRGWRPRATAGTSRSRATSSNRCTGQRPLAAAVGRLGRSVGRPRRRMSAFHAGHQGFQAKSTRRSGPNSGHVSSGPDTSEWTCSSSSVLGPVGQGLVPACNHRKPAAAPSTETHAHLPGTTYLLVPTELRTSGRGEQPRHSRRAEGGHDLLFLAEAPRRHHRRP